jgi:hypothetical protein
MSKVALAILVLCAAVQEDKKAPPDPKPRIAMALPLAVTPDASAKVTLRGLNLDQASEVKLAEPIEGVSIAIKSKGKAEIPKETDPAVYGDTKIEIEIKLPEAAPEKLQLLALNAAGQTTPYELLVLPKDKVVLEKEPNGGFATAQPVEAGQVVQGAVSQPLDVDVFKFTGKKGESWRIEVEANRRGSILDPMLTVHDAAGNTLAVSDDSASTRDASIQLTLPADGVYYVTLMDAHNSGGATHAYLLRLRRDN